MKSFASRCASRRQVGVIRTGKQKTDMVSLWTLSKFKENLTQAGAPLSAVCRTQHTCWLMGGGGGLLSACSTSFIQHSNSQRPKLLTHHALSSQLHLRQVCVRKWTCVSAAHVFIGTTGQVERKCLFLFPPAQGGSAQTVPALATIQPKNNHERKNTPLSPSPHLSSPLIHCHFSCLEWQTI